MRAKVNRHWHKSKWFSHDKHAFASNDSKSTELTNAPKNTREYVYTDTPTYLSIFKLGNTKRLKVPDIEIKRYPVYSCKMYGYTETEAMLLFLNLPSSEVSIKMRAEMVFGNWKYVDWQTFYWENDKLAVYYLLAVLHVCVFELFNIYKSKQCVRNSTSQKAETFGTFQRMLQMHRLLVKNQYSLHQHIHDRRDIYIVWKQSSDY